MLISYETLSVDALRGIAEQYVLSQLSDLDSEPNTQEWVDKAIEMVKSGELVIEFSQADESVTLKPFDHISMLDNT